jgi:GNAT superfamily N-acetyltransferase
VRLGPAEPGDARALARILGGWVAETPWMPRIHSAEDDLRHAERLIDRMEVTVARNWRGAQGFLARDGEVVQALYLAPRARCRGYGSRLVAAAQAAVSRLELWCFQANHGALRFYARHGFTEVERTAGMGNDEKLPDVRLEWHGGAGR